MQRTANLLGIGLFSVAAAATAGIITFAAASAATSSQTDARVQASPVECASDEAVLRSISEFAYGGPAHQMRLADSRAALNEWIRTEYPGFEQARFDARPAEEDAATTFALNVDGAPKVLAFASELPEVGWRVTEFVGCANVLRNANGAAE